MEPKITSASKSCPYCGQRFHQKDASRKTPVHPFCSVRCASLFGVEMTSSIAMCSRCLKWNSKGTACRCQKENRS